MLHSYAWVINMNRNKQIIQNLDEILDCKNTYELKKKLQELHIEMEEEAIQQIFHDMVKSQYKKIKEELDLKEVFEIL